VIVTAIVTVIETVIVTVIETVTVTVTVIETVTVTVIVIVIETTDVGIPATKGSRRSGLRGQVKPKIWPQQLRGAYLTSGL
jgi:hypothetical protein